MSLIRFEILAFPVVLKTVTKEHHQVWCLPSESPASDLSRNVKTIEQQSALPFFVTLATNGDWGLYLY